MILTDIASLRWDTVAPGDAPPVSDHPMDCEFAWATSCGPTMYLVQCTRPWHCTGQHVAEGSDLVLAVHPW